ncbi:MAG: AAA family ATPase, partial [Planctomycetota bacterium]
QIFEAIQTRSLTPLGQHRDDVPPKLAEITTRCLTKRIEDRFATAGELADHLSRFAEQRTSITRLIAPTGKVAGLPWTQPDLIGRDDIIEDITQAWITEHPRSRLVTLTGGGGVGKTQTAAAIARRIAGVGEQDVIWIELAHATNVDQLDAAVAAALGVAVNDPAGGNDDSQSKDRGDRVLDTIAVGRPMVLVLDNVEQIISETAAAVSRWLGRSETLRVLVTSQTPLRIGGEQVRQLPPLSYAMRRTESSLFRDIYAEDMEWSSHESMATENGANDASSGGEALTLLMRRARAVRPDFEINDDNREDALEICRLVDGNPLAIELAAARLAVMNLPELRERIRQSFEVLKTNRVDRPERHKTLHDVVAWSFECLDADQSSAFLALSMWPAPMPSRIAEGLLDHLKLSGLDMLEDLAARNLIHVRNTGSLMRVQTTAAIQRFAENKLAPAQRNVFATALIACLSGPLKSTVEELPGDQRHHLASNLFAASDAIESTPSTAATRLSAVLMADRLAGDHWDATIRQQRLTPMLSLAQGITQLQLGLRLADAQRLSGKTDAAITMCDRIAQKIGALTESDDAVDELTVAVGRLRARIQYRRGQMAGAIASLEAVLPKSDEAITDPDPFAPPVPERLLVERIDALLELVEIQRRAGHLAVARSQLRRAKAWIAAHPVLEERTLRCQIQSGKISLQTGNLAEARQTFDAAVKSVTTKTDPRDLQQALLGRAAAHAEWGDFEAAERDYDRCEKISRRLGDLPTLAQALNNRALSQDDAGQSAAACETLERALEIYHRLQDSVGIAIASAAKAAALLQLNRCDETIAILESPEIRDSIAPDSIHRAMMAGDLGAAKHRVGELKDAKKWLCDSLQHLDQLGGGLTAERLLVAIELASVLGELKDPAAAAAHQRAAKLVSDWPRQRRDRGRVAAAIEAFETMLP